MRRAECANSYRGFSLGIHSSIPFPELVPQECDPDVFIQVGEEREPPPEARGIPRWIKAESDGVLLAWEHVGTIRVRAGREIVVNPAPGIEERVVRLFVLGASISVLLQQRGFTVIHASSVSINGEAVAFVGEKGVGKSTLAAILNARGHSLIADDTIALRNGCPTPEVVPGFPVMKLWPDSVEAALACKPEQFPSLYPKGKKRNVDVRERFASNPVPLRRIFLIFGGEKPEISKIEPQKALVGLLPHWYGARFGEELLDACGRDTHLLQCGDIVRKVPVFVLKRQRTIETLPELALMVERHLDKEP